MASPLITRMQPFGGSIFTAMTQRAFQFDAINLGQGFPDTEPEPHLRQAVHEAIEGGLNQYAPAAGMPVLREAIAEHQQRFYGLSINPDTEVLVTVGATEALSASVMALIEPGQEVITFDPSFDIYGAAVALAGGVHRTVELTFPDWQCDPVALETAVSERTRIIVLNNPHNPTGKVFTLAELQVIADVAQRHDLIVITDEVYEHMVFDGAVHHSIATLPGMWDRTVTISSGGKTFSATGWKVGWVSGPQILVQAIATVKNTLTFAACGPFHPAIASGLRLPDEFFAQVASSMSAQRDVLVHGLTSAGLPVAPVAGGYFAVADISALGATDAVQFCWDLPEKVGVVGVPVSAFCADPSSARNLVRFAFCKGNSVLAEGVRRLTEHGRGIM